MLQKDSFHITNSNIIYSFAFCAFCAWLMTPVMRFGAEKQEFVNLLRIVTIPNEV